MPTPLVSVFTPVHPAGVPFMVGAAKSLDSQTFRDFEWVVVPNGGAGFVSRIDRDIWAPAPESCGSRIGSLKKFACDQCCGTILLEMDCDDELTPDALAEVVKAFEDPVVQFAYSNFAEFSDVATGNGRLNHKYPSQYGWQYRDSEGYQEAIAWPPTAHSIRRIEWAPNHLRAWRASAYRELGGHNPEMAFGDDHDLICRTYLKYGEAGMRHIDKLLYLYRVHENNTVKSKNAEIQAQANLNYLRYIEPLAMRWAKENNLRCLDLGGRFEKREGYESVDLYDADVIMDLNLRFWVPKNNNRNVTPIETSSIGVIRCHHTLEHLDDQIRFFNEAYRVLAPGGFLLLELPSATGPGAFRDPTHRQFMVSQSIWYWTNEQYARYIRPQYQGRFQLSRVEDYKWQDGTPVVAAELICLKEGGPRMAGEILI